MNTDNPFFFSASPYECNPFRLLGIHPEDPTAMIDAVARAREQLLARGVEPVPGVVVERGDFNRAAHALQDPLRRLAFDFIANCSED